MDRSLFSPAPYTAAVFGAGENRKTFIVFDPYQQATPTGLPTGEDLQCKMFRHPSGPDYSSRAHKMIIKPQPKPTAMRLTYAGRMVSWHNRVVAVDAQRAVGVGNLSRTN